tara:strand:- start:120 stop:431 length:312 start_codon:yes stop_codon:yes gene_type:complete
MAGNTEEALARVQAEAANAQGVQKHHKSTLDYISERIFTYIFGIAFISLLIAWLTAPAYIKYLLSAFFILIPLIWGLLSLKRIQKIKKKRDLQVKDIQLNSGQ